MFHFLFECARAGSSTMGEEEEPSSFVWFLVMFGLVPSVVLLLISLSRVPTLNDEEPEEDDQNEDANADAIVAKEEEAKKDD